MINANLFERLKTDGWSLNEHAVAQQLEVAIAESGKQPRPDDIVKAILDLDLKQVGAPCLPEDINRADSKKLAGPHILQLVEATDISRPTKFQETVLEDRKNRLLRLKLTDGSKTCIAMEYQPIASLQTKHLIPGVKIKIQNALIRVGSLLLDSSKSISVLGGRVERLAAAWEVQQLYGGTTERTKDSTISTGDSTKPDKPLPFKHFDAKANNGGHEKMKKALAAVFVPAVGVAVQAVGGKNSGSGGPGTGPNSQQQRTTGVNKDSLPQPKQQTGASTSTATNDAAKSKLLERLSAHEDAHGRYGRGGRGGRGKGRGRRGRFNNDDDGGDDGSMTLEEWEAKKKGGLGVGVKSEESNKTDEQLARELQRQLDLEDMAAAHGQEPMGSHSSSSAAAAAATAAGNNSSNLQSELLGMFSYNQNEEDTYPSGGYGRGRGDGGRARGGGGSRGRGRRDGGRGGGRSNGGRGKGPPSRGRGRGGRS